MLKKWMYILCFLSTVSAVVLPFSYTNHKLHVIGGEEVFSNKYPWFATIRNQDEKDNSLPLGGGALIAPQWVLTAGHLFESSWYLNYEPNLKVTFNQYDLDKSDNIVTVFAKKVIKAPNYQQGNDLALIKLDKPVEHITPIIMNHQNLQYDQQATIMGYGKTDFDPSASIPTKLHDLNIPLLNPLDHREYLNSINYRASEYDIIGGHIGGIVQTPTSGDSGGPLIQMINGSLKIIGIYKTAIVKIEIAEEQYPKLFTSISKNFDWIQQKIRNENIIIDQKITIQQHFFRPFEYEKHLFTKETKRKDVKRFVEGEINKIFHHPFYLKIDREEENVLESTDYVPNGDYFNFELISSGFKTHFLFLAANVGNKKFYKNIFDQVLTKFKDEIDIKEHHLTTDHVRGQAFLFVDGIVSNIAQDVHYELLMKGYNPNKKIVNDASYYVWKGDWFDFTLSIPENGSKEFRFRAKNVAGSIESTNQFNRVQDYFRNNVNFIDHRLTTSHNYTNAKEWVQKKIEEIIDNNNFVLNTYTSESINLTKMMLNTDAQIGHGDKLRFNFGIDSIGKDINIKFKNVGNNHDQGIFWDMLDYWNDNFRELNVFTIKSNEQSLWNYIYFKLIDQFRDVRFTINLLLLDAHNLLSRLTTYEFDLIVGDYSHQFSLNLGSLKKEVLNKYNLKNFFDQEFFFHEHQLTTKNNRADAKNIVILWIKKISNFRYFQFLSPNFDDNINIVNNSDRVSNGDCLDLKIKLDNEEITFSFKVRNVQDRAGSGYLLDAITIFSNGISARWYSLHSNMEYETIYNIVLQIIQKNYGSLPNTFSLKIKNVNLHDQIGIGNQIVDFEIEIDSVIQVFKVQVFYFR